MRDTLLNSFAPLGLPEDGGDGHSDRDAKPGEVKPAPAARLSAQGESAMRLLHALGYLYGCHGQTKRALVLQLIAARLAPDDTGVLRSLAYTFLMDGSPERALAIIERLRAMDDGDHPALDLLKSRALWDAGREIEARRSFRDFLDRRRQP